MNYLKLAFRPKGCFSGGNFMKYHIFDKGIYIWFSTIRGDDDPDIRKWSEFRNLRKAQSFSEISKFWSFSKFRYPILNVNCAWSRLDIIGNSSTGNIDALFDYKTQWLPWSIFLFFFFFFFLLLLSRNWFFAKVNVLSCEIRSCQVFVSASKTNS